MKTLALFLLFSVAACEPEPESPISSVHEIAGTDAERAAAVSRLIGRHAPLPSALLDAHFLEEQLGDGFLGPSDFHAFYALTVAPADLAAWRSALPPLPASNEPPAYAVPEQPRPWWLTRDDFSRLAFYDPEPLTGRLHGWVGIAPDGRIFIFTFTT